VNQTAISLASVVGQRPEISDQRSEVRGTASPNALRDSAHSTGQPYKRAGAERSIGTTNRLPRCLISGQFDFVRPRSRDWRAAPGATPAYSSRRTISNV